MRRGGGICIASIRLMLSRGRQKLSLIRAAGESLMKGEPQWGKLGKSGLRIHFELAPLSRDSAAIHRAPLIRVILEFHLDGQIGSREVRQQRQIGDHERIDDGCIAAGRETDAVPNADVTIPYRKRGRHGRGGCKARRCARLHCGDGARHKGVEAKGSVLRSFYCYAVGRGHATSAPLPTAIPKFPPMRTPHIYSTDELKRLLAATEMLDTPRGCCWRWLIAHCCCFCTEPECGSMKPWHSL